MTSSAELERSPFLESLFEGFIHPGAWSHWLSGTSEADLKSSLTQDLISDLNCSFGSLAGFVQSGCPIEMLPVPGYPLARA
jgi:hypothetical protein